MNNGDENIKKDEITDNIESPEIESEKELEDAEFTEKERKEAEEAAQTIEAIKKFTDEDDMGEISLKSILGGDILQSKFFRNQILWFIFVAILMILYTGNRYSSQQDIIKIDSLRNKLQDVKYNVLTQSSELMNLSRQSKIEERLKLTSDSLLQNPTSPPFLIENDSTTEN